jgi:arylsulfatase A-like enzyme
MAGRSKAATDRCPSWRQLYRITATLCEAAGVDHPKTAAEASELIARLDALATHESGPAVEYVTADGCKGDGIPF